MELSLDNTIVNEVESSIERQSRDVKFCYDIAEQNREMERYVNECIIKASGNKKAINEMYVLNESSFTSKIKNFFLKIINFFKKIFEKFIAAMRGIFQQHKNYIDSYNVIITKCKWKAGDVYDIKNRFIGIARILEVANNVNDAIIGMNIDRFVNENNIPELEINESIYSDSKKLESLKLPEKISNGEGKQQMFDQFIKQGYWNNVKDFNSYKETDSEGNVDTAATFSSWFDGGKGTVTWNENYVDENFQTIINVTYAGESYLKKLESIVSAITKKMKESSDKMEKYVKEASDKINKSIDSTPNSTTSDKTGTGKQTDTSTGTGTGETDTSTVTGTGTKTDTEQSAEVNAADMTLNYSGGYIEEISITKSNNSSNDENKTDLNKTGDKEIKNATKTHQNIQNMQVKGFKSADVDTSGANTKDLKDKAQKYLDIDMNNRQVRINESVNISSTIAKKMLESFEKTTDDFYKIIKAHVQWYLSNPGEDKKEENKTNRPRNLNLNAGAVQVEKNTPKS